MSPPRYVILNCNRKVTIVPDQLTIRCFNDMKYHSIWYCTTFCGKDAERQPRITIIDDYDSHGRHRDELENSLFTNDKYIYG